MQRNMTPDQIKSALKNRNITQSGLARDLDCTPQNVFLTIKDPTRSFPVASHIARALGKNLEDVWPETYQPNQQPPKPGRPLTHGLYAHQAT